MQNEHQNRKSSHIPDNLFEALEMFVVILNGLSKDKMILEHFMGAMINGRSFVVCRLVHQLIDTFQKSDPSSLIDKEEVIDDKVGVGLSNLCSNARNATIVKM
jgi:hypothetical protein